LIIAKKGRDKIQLALQHASAITFLQLSTVVKLSTSLAPFVPTVLGGGGEYY
jgi:hypothetical protein